MLTTNKKQSKLLRNNLLSAYERFRIDIVRSFLDAEGAYVPWKELTGLCTPKNSKNDTKPPAKNIVRCKTKWMRITTGAKILNEFALLLSQTLSSTSVVHVKVAAKLLDVANVFKGQAFEFEHTGKIDNPVDFAYGIIAQWDPIRDYQPNDFIRDAINAL